MSCRFHYLSSPCSHPPVTSCIHLSLPSTPVCSLRSDTVRSVRASHGRADHQQATPPPRTHLHPHLRLRPRLSLLLPRSSSFRANNHCPFQTFLTSSTKKASSRALSALRYRRSLHIQSARCTENEERRATPKNCWTRWRSCWTRSTPSGPSWPTTTKSKSTPALVR